MKVSQINKLINAKKQQIVLLQEKRQSMIRHSLNDSDGNGVICRIKDICKLKTGSTPKNNEGINNTGNGYGWVTPSDFSHEYIESIQKFIETVVVERDNIDVFPIGSILFIGIGGTLGKFALLRQVAYSNQQITAIIPKDKGVISEFLLFSLLDKASYIKNTANYTTLPIVNNAQLGKIEIAIPPLDVQNDIVDSIKVNCRKIDEIIYRLNEELSFFTEYRTRLISDVVTGKLDVRDVVVPEYEVENEVADEVEDIKEMEVIDG